MGAYRDRYDASSLNVAEIKSLAMRVVRETNKPRIDQNRWLLETRRWSYEEKIKDSRPPATERTWSEDRYYLRDDGEITSEWTQGYDCIFAPNEPLTKGGETILRGDALLFFDYERWYRDFWDNGMHFVGDRYRGKRLGDGVSRKGLGIIKVLQAMLPAGAAVPATSAPSSVARPAAKPVAKETASVVAKATPLTPDQQKADGLRRAASLGDSQAAYSLGKVYEEGQGGLVPNHENAKLWYYLASKKGHVAAKEAYDKLK